MEQPRAAGVGEKTHRSAASSGTSPTCENPGGDPAEHRTRFVLVEGEWSNHYTTAAPRRMNVEGNSGPSDSHMAAHTFSDKSSPVETKNTRDQCDTSTNTKLTECMRVTVRKREKQERKRKRYMKRGREGDSDRARGRERQGQKEGETGTEGGRDRDRRRERNRKAKREIGRKEQEGRGKGRWIDLHWHDHRYHLIKGLDIRTKFHTQYAHANVVRSTDEPSQFFQLVERPSWLWRIRYGGSFDVAWACSFDIGCVKLCLGPGLGYCTQDSLLAGLKLVRVLIGKQRSNISQASDAVLLACAAGVSDLSGSFASAIPKYSDNDARHKSLLVREWLLYNRAKVIETPLRICATSITPVSGGHQALTRRLAEEWDHIEQDYTRKVISNMQTRLEDVIRQKGYRTRDLDGSNSEVLRADAAWSNAGIKGRGKREITEKTRRPMPSSGKIPTCENPEVTRTGIEPSSPWWGASRLTAQPPRTRGNKVMKFVSAKKVSKTFFVFTDHSLQNIQPFFNNVFSTEPLQRIPGGALNTKLAVPDQRKETKGYRM
ncbi:hypothetical protein PR048_027630 [Dryococelus australis]|uniref:Uncharacterized protein n=1 Tax=Dryococelus australis TaxID=614101 RepID=A0ABQ9GH20_9NEOP|nr:hypothetical protein PR048_027630 [Dryococelus australis]